MIKGRIKNVSEFVTELVSKLVNELVTECVTERVTVGETSTKRSFTSKNLVLRNHGFLQILYI